MSPRLLDPVEALRERAERAEARVADLEDALRGVVETFELGASLRVQDADKLLAIIRSLVVSVSSETR